MMIKITKLRFIDGYELPVRGYVYVNNSPVIGGEITEPESYVKKPSYRQGLKWLTAGCRTFKKNGRA